MQSQSQSVSDFLAGIDDASPETAPIRERIAEEVEQLDKLALGAQEQEAHVTNKSLTEDFMLMSRGRDDKERRMRNRGKRDF